ncbi:deoxyribonuclease-1-like 2 [Sceloporus undulatus]|uniref:deoxyribonuclease-1-like 2 n=1 Tax=Sceloporus undulatus TaxID=8520 RepID=UPI001C4B30BF|nr:deoxyribonuclease-1-like 2 [Sceloporus undulatus]
MRQVGVTEEVRTNLVSSLLHLVGVARKLCSWRGSSSVTLRTGRHMGRSMNHLLMLIFGLALLLHPASPLRICAFNIQSFGDTKLSDAGISKIIVKILSRYDIALVQEVRDSDLSAVTDLMERLNRASKNEYAYEISESLGRENYKEMYLFLYRTGSVSLLDKYQYPNKDNAFSRAPFIVKFSAPESKESELILVPLHTPPNEAVAEIDALYDVYLKIIDKWGTDNMMFLGDFNADCSYVGKKDWASIRLRTSEVFKWLIPDSEDTTVGDSDCAYDRIVVSGSQLKKWVKANSAKVYDFQKDLKLSQEEALAVSDHFPVEVTLKS